MERALNIGLLAGALGGQLGLPTPEELQSQIGQVEVQLFRRQTSIPDDLLETAWYLHAIASVDQAQQLYTVTRQRQAFAVSAHVFDMALSDPRWQRLDRLILGFAAAIGYRRGDRDPNATAIVRRLMPDISADEEPLGHIDTLALEAGLALLGFETRTLFGLFSTWRRQLQDVARLVELPTLETTVYGTTHAVVLGAEDLLHYLARGESNRLGRARDRLSAAAAGGWGPADLPAKWVAYHLVKLADEAASGSVWSPDLLPPDVPEAVRHAFTLGSPPVLTLWSPQQELLTSTPSPFDPEMRRMVLSVPTSGGKTLVSQLLSLTYLETGGRSICYVAPTRSLCREVRRSMASRLRIVQKEAGADRPDYPPFTELLSPDIDLWDFLIRGMEADQPPPDVEVMTPERLNHLLRHDAQAVLDQFGMFIFDEAQLIKEASRGFTLEAVITYLHHRTLATDHRIILLSAAMGNAAHIARWISPEDQPTEPFESDWRGPRRLHALFSTEPNWAETTHRSSGGAYAYRLHTPLKGKVRLQLADGKTVALQVVEPVGTLVRKAHAPDQISGTKKDAQKSDTNYAVAARMIELLGHAGTALVVAATRQTAQRIARVLAEKRPEHPDSFALADFVRTQLGDTHPLVGMLRHGVGFHHAGLPMEVLEALEDALRADLLAFLTCTSTLTEGINLPVHTVVIYDEYYEQMPSDLRLKGPRLVNAAGRAGRAGKETEGWIVLVRADRPSDASFGDLAPTPEELTISSSLEGDHIFDELADLEAQTRTDADNLFRSANSAAGSFVAFIWFFLADSESRGVDPMDADVMQLTRALLVGEPYSEVLERLAGQARDLYARTDPRARRRWPKTGTSIGSARTLDELAGRLTSELRFMSPEAAGAIRQPEPAIAMLASTQALEILLALPENTAPWRFRVTAAGVDIPVSVEAVLSDWLRGLTYSELAEEHLGDIRDGGRRIEEMVDAITSHFEHYLAWTVGALVELVNTNLVDLDSEHRLCPELGPYIRHGVNDRRSLELMLKGLRSRRLAHEVARQMPDNLPSEEADPCSWLSTMTLHEWRDRFGASTSELLDLLDLTRTRRRSLLRTLIETSRAEISVLIPQVDLEFDRQLLRLARVPGPADPAPIALYSGEQLVAEVRSADHSDVEMILDSGLELAFTLAGGSLTIFVSADGE